ncbi:MAG: hypothetical protein LBR68_07240, partial [Lachnoclostridium sp.]|nr:hypothetical protein [Lachnoclostridium sp.]
MKQKAESTKKCLNSMNGARTKSILLSIYIHFFTTMVSTIAVRYSESVSINGFDTNFGELQPLWFGVTDLV